MVHENFSSTCSRIMFKLVVRVGQACVKLTRKKKKKKQKKKKLKQGDDKHLINS